MNCEIDNPRGRPLKEGAPMTRCIYFPDERKWVLELLRKRAEKKRLSVSELIVNTLETAVGEYK